MSDTVKDITGIFALIVIAGIVTTLVLPGRQTPAVIGQTFGGFSQALAVAMGGSYSGLGMSTIGIG